MIKDSFLVVADVHVGKDLFGLPELGQDIKDQYIAAVNKAINLKVEFFISCGDLFETNKPLSKDVDFVLQENKRLIEKGIKCLYLVGDHSKNIDNKNWELICGFTPISEVPSFAGVDYNDDPNLVITELKRQIIDKKEKLKFIFLHGHLPELFGFCQDKKKLILPWQLIKDNCPNIEAVLLGDVHMPVSKTIDGIFTAYCGSLGVTALNEGVDRYLYYYDGKKLNSLDFPSTRDFIEIKIEEEVSQLNEEIKLSYIDAIFNSQKAKGKKPVVLIRYVRKFAASVKLFDFLHEVAIVKNTSLSLDDKEEANINIRSEIGNENDIAGVVKEMLMTNGTFTEENLSLSLDLLASLKDNTYKNILDKLKKTQLA